MTARIAYYRVDGSEMTMKEWATGRADGDWERAQRQTTIGDVEISTVWLGMDHSHGDGPPLIFETMVFGGGLDQQQWRYSTLEAAHAGHDEAVQKVRMEADAFRAAASDPELVAAARRVKESLATHCAQFSIEDYDAAAYRRLIEEAELTNAPETTGGAE